MPAAGAGGLAGAALVGIGPVTRVAGVGVAAIAVVGGGPVLHKVVARAQLTGQIRVIQAHAGVEHRHRDRRQAGRDVPGGHRVDGRDRRGIGCAQVPLAHGGRDVQLAGAEVRVVGQGQQAPALIWHGPLDIGLRRQTRRQLR